MQPITANSYSPEVAALIPAFPPKGGVKYRLLEHGGYADEVNERDELLANRRVLGEPTTMTAQVLIFDPFKGDNVLVNVSKGSRVQGQGGSAYMAQAIEYLTFDRMGETSLGSQDLPMYRFMELHPSNKSNVLTGVHSKNPQMPMGGWKFERVEKERTAQELAERGREIDRLRSELLANTPSENLAIATRLPSRLRMNFSMGDDDLYSQLRTLAETEFDSVFNAMNSQYAKTEALINDVLDAKLIRFDHAERKYFDAKTGQAILSVPNGEPKDILRDYLVDTQGAREKNRLKGLLSDYRGGKEKKEKKGDEPKGPKGIKLEDGEQPPVGHVKGAFGRWYPVEQTESVEA